MILRSKAVALLAASLLTFGLSVSCASNTVDTTVQGINEMPLSWNPKNLQFRSFYGWEEKAGSWKMNQISSSRGGSVAVHTFRPPFFTWKKGTVFMLHSYLEHSGLRVKLALEFVKKGWIVVGIDLPGHGLSTGKRADIDDFADYLAAFESALSFRFWPKPWRAIGHSTGGATILMALQNPKWKFDLVVLEAPLVRTVFWEPSLWLKNIVENWFSMVNRIIGIHDVEDDPLYIKEVPLHWLDAVEAYYKSTMDWVPVAGRVLILQGDTDPVVDAKYNIPFLKGILREAEIVEIAGGTHHLLVDEGQAGEAARRELFSRW